LWIYLAVTDLYAANRNEGCCQLTQTLKELNLDDNCIGERIDHESNTDSVTWRFGSSQGYDVA
jgi:hypothetical protein